MLFGSLFLPRGRSEAVVHCTHCGTATRKRPDGHWQCPTGHVDYENPAPTAGVAIVQGRQVLLAKRAGPPKKGLWDFPGGFIEPGEVVTEGLRREIHEETGLRLTSLRRLHQAPGEYAGRPTLNFMYTAEADGEPVAADDVAELQWFPLDALPELAWPHEAVALQKLQGA